MPRGDLAIETASINTKTASLSAVIPRFRVLWVVALEWLTDSLRWPAASVHSLSGHGHRNQVIIDIAVLDLAGEARSR